MSVVLDTWSFDDGPWIGGVVALSIVFVLLFGVFVALMLHVESYSLLVDSGELVKAMGPGSVARARGDDGEDGEDEEGEEGEDDQPNDEDDE